MKKNIIDKIGMTIISIVIIVFSVIIGANEKGLRILPITILLFLEILYLIIRKIMFKEKIAIKNKVDICVLLFMSSTILPYIFKTYSTYQGTIEFIIKYFFVYATYLTVRNTIDSKRKVNELIYVTCISSLIVGFFAIDRGGNYYSKNLLEKLNLAYTGEYSLFGTFGYKNTLAIYFSFCIFLIINQIQNTSNKFKKIVYTLYICIAIYIIYKSLSRVVWVLLVAALIIYYILYYLKKILKYKNKIGNIAVVLAVFASIGLVFLFGIGINVSKPYEFTEKSYYRKLNYDFEPNQQYTIDFEINVKDISEDSKRYMKIKIIEFNEYFKSETLLTKKVKLNEKSASLEFKTTGDVNRIDIEILNDNNETISIERCFINNIEYPFNYKYLPYKLGLMLTTYSLGDESIIQRLDLWQDCIKIAKMSPIIGQGGNTWKVLSQAVQEYPYGMKESHSYFFELLISFGIVGVTLFLIFVIGFYKKSLKSSENRIYKLPILFGLGIILLHSLVFDFNMSFILILLLVFIYMAALLYDTKQEIKGLKIVDYFVFGLLTIILGICIGSNLSKYYITDISSKKDIAFYDTSYQYQYINKLIKNEANYKDILKEIQTYINKEPYYSQTEMYEKYWEFVLENKKNISEEEMIKYVSYISGKYKKIKFSTPMYINTILPRVYTMKNAYLELNEADYKNQELINQIKELKQIVIDEYKINSANIKDEERNHCNNTTVEKIMEEYNKIIEEIESKVQ